MRTNLRFSFVLPFVFLMYRAAICRQVPVLVLGFCLGVFQDALSPGLYFGCNTIANLLLVSLINLFKESIPTEKKILPFFLVFLLGTLVHNIFCSCIIWLKKCKGCLYQQESGWVLRNYQASKVTKLLLRSAPLSRLSENTGAILRRCFLY